MSGLCVPEVVVDVPGALGKVPLISDRVIECTSSRLLVRGYDGSVLERSRTCV